jgi:hypothetical protein
MFVPRVMRFRDGRWCESFATASELCDRVHDALEQWLTEMVVRLREVSVARWRSSARRLTLTAFGAALAPVPLVAMSLASRMTTRGPTRPEAR